MRARVCLVGLLCCCAPADAFFGPFGEGAKDGSEAGSDGPEWLVGLGQLVQQAHTKISTKIKEHVDKHLKNISLDEMLQTFNKLDFDNITATYDKMTTHMKKIYEKNHDAIAEERGWIPDNLVNMTAGFIGGAVSNAQGVAGGVAGAADAAGGQVGDIAGAATGAAVDMVQVMPGVNFTANQTEWAEFLAKCYGDQAAKAAMAGGVSSGACALVPAACPLIGAWGMWKQAQTAMAVGKEGLDALPCADVVKAYPPARVLPEALLAELEGGTAAGRTADAKTVGLLGAVLVGLGLLTFGRRRKPVALGRDGANLV